LLIGIRSTQLAPVLKFTLPSGLCVYDSKFRDVYEAMLCFGGPHEVFTRAYRQAGYRVTSGMLQVLFTESAAAYMGGIRAVVGASIEEEEAAEPPSVPASAPPTEVPPPASVGPAGDKTTLAASTPPTEETVQPKTADSTVISDLVVDCPIDSLPVVTTEPEPVTDVDAKEVPPDLCAPLTVCVDEAPQLVASRVLPDDLRQLPALDDPPEPATIVEAPERDMLLMVAPSAPDCPPTPPELSTGMDGQRISPMEELAQGFTAVTLVMVDKPPDKL
jgi:hypothetical protein